MKLKYYLRGLGIGIICTAIIMGIALSGNKKETMTDTEIIERARLLGMVMLEDTKDLSETEGQESPDDNLAGPQEVQGQESGSKADAPEVKDDSAGQQKDDSTGKQKDDGAAKQEDGSQAKGVQEDKGQKDKEPSTPAQTNENKTQQGTSPKIIKIEIKAGEFSDAVSQKLFQAGLVSDAEAFNKYLTHKGADQTLRVGVYEIPEGATQDQIIDILQNKED